MINKILVSDIHKATNSRFIRDNEINHIISILDPEYLDSIWEFMLYKMQIKWDYFVFYDIEYEEFNGPKPEKEHIERMMEIFNKLISSEEKINLLVHCTAGICRSTAAVFLLLYLIEKDEQKALDRLLEIRPQAFPNLRIVDLYDKTYGTQLFPFLYTYREKIDIWSVK